MKFALIYGGRSVEHDWSIAMYEHFAQRINNDSSIMEGLKAVIYLSPKGELLIRHTQKQAAPTHSDMISKANLVPIEHLPRTLKELEVFVFSILQGQDGEDGQIQSIAQFFDIPGSFGSKAAAMLAADKYFQARLVEAECEDVTPIPTVCVHPFQVEEALPHLQSVIATGPCVVKPNTLGGSFMTEAVNSLDDFDLRTYAESIRNYDDRFLVQRRIVGTEHTCGVICQEGKYHALPVARIQNTSQFLGYKEKTSKGSYEVVFPDEKSVLCHRIQKISERIAKLFDVHTFCRLDFIVDDQERIFFFELNIVPGLTAGSIFPKMMARAGLDVMDLIPIAFENEDIRHKRELQRKRATSEIRYGKVLVQ